MAKFGLKLKNIQSDYTWLYSWNENGAYSPAKPITFGSIAEAEDYAQAHELPNFIIEPLNEDLPSSGKRLLNG